MAKKTTIMMLVLIVSLVLTAAFLPVVISRFSNLISITGTILNMMQTARAIFLDWIGDLAVNAIVKGTVPIPTGGD